MSAGLGATLLWTTLGYLCGSVSFAYLIPRWWRGIDLRQYGSRKLSGSNVFNYLGFGGMALVGLLDIGKAALPAWLALRLGLGLATAACAGLAAMVGHNWSLFLDLKGGRGIGAALGLLLCIFPWGAPWMLGWVAAGRLAPHAAAAPALLGFIGLPLLAVAFGEPAATVWACAGMLLVTIVKRVEANRETLPAGESAWRVLVRRLVLDRDMADFDAWIRRAPGEDAEAAR